jgi:hypothetical protein
MSGFERTSRISVLKPRFQHPERTETTIETGRRDAVAD